ncbi:MAG: PspC domain-containing protein [Candidatus Nanoarchaeia archaeon]|nr:PspC domain-containing protein [Candidatus Nanoarchaeia archaeon]
MKDRLYKSKNDKLIFGVCGGVANYFEIDSTIVRVVTALLLVIVPNFILPLYLILAIILPEDSNEKKEKVVSKINNSYFLGGGLIAIGLMMLLDSYNVIAWETMWPAILIIIGAVMLWGKNKKN